MGFEQYPVSAPNLDAIIEGLGKRGAFAVVRALTATAKDIERAETLGLSESLDNPTPFTLRAFGTEAATKANPTARVFMRPLQSKYLQYQIDGGQRAYKGFELKLRGQSITAYALPGGKVPLDQYGNISRATIIALTRELNSSGSAKRYFVGKPKGARDRPAGVYARVNDNANIEPLLVFANSAQYQKRFAWSVIAKRTVDANFERNLIQALAATYCQEHDQ